MPRKTRERVKSKFRNNQKAINRYMYRWLLEKHIAFLESMREERGDEVSTKTLTMYDFMKWYDTTFGSEFDI